MSGIRISCPFFQFGFFAPQRKGLMVFGMARTHFWVQELSDFNQNSRTGAMNAISKTIKTGDLGELLVQIRLLQFDVQCARSKSDSGNDWLATRGDAFRAIQVKTTTGDPTFRESRREFQADFAGRPAAA